jgi:methionine-rich copper-binding protein CopC
MGLTIVLALALSLGLLAVASAHAKLVSSDPAAGARLTAAPAKMTLVFSEEISENESDSNFTVADASGKTVGTGKLDTTDLDHKTMSGALDAGLGDGVYTVAWNALTPDDNGHSEGSFTFGVNADPGAQPTAEPEHEEEATPTSAAQPAATVRPAATAAASPTAAPAGGAPGTLPRTAENGPGSAAYLLLGALALLAGGAALRRAWSRML